MNTFHKLFVQLSLYAIVFSVPLPSPQFLPPVVPSNRNSPQALNRGQYRPIQVGYGPQPDSNNQRPPLPVYYFDYNYNVSHPSQSTSLQYLRSGPGQGRASNGRPVPHQYQQQYLKNQNYAPVILTNPLALQRSSAASQSEAVRNKLLRDRESLLQYYSGSEVDREPENEGIRSRVRNGQGRAIGSKSELSTGNKIFYGQGQRYSDNVAYSGQSGIQLPYTGPSTTPPPIQIPYITTPNALRKIQDLQKNSKQAVAGFRSQLGLVNPLSLQSPTVTQALVRTNLQTSPVANVLVPLSAVSQTPAGTWRLQDNLNNLNNLQQLQNAVAQSVRTHQSGGSINPLQFANPNLHILKGLAITPENQRTVGHIVFNDPTNPTSSLYASTAQKIFILPQSDQFTRSADKDNSINFDDDTPAEILVTVVDDDSSGNSTTGEKGKVLSNFSLFLLPSSYKKCAQGYRKAHDGKCRLIIKLRGRIAQPLIKK